jgi:tetratricopeptide (TPR) repeat protein
MMFLGRGLLALGPPGYHLAERLFATAAPSTEEAKGWMAFVQGLMAYQQGDHDGALQKLRQASVVLPHSADVAVSLALALANADKWDVAIESGERALKFYEEAGRAASLWQMLAWGYLITGRYASVLDLMQRMREGGVSITLIHLPLLLARAVVWEEQPPMAVMRRLLRQSGMQVRACLRFVEHLSQTKHENLGVAILAALPPSTAIQAIDTMATRAAGYGKAEQVLWAANALRQLELVPELSLAIASVASLIAGEVDAAAAYAQRADELGPGQPAVQQRLAMVRLLTGDEKAARSAAAKAIMAGSSDALSAALVALGLLEKHQVREARKVFTSQRVGDALGALLGHLVQTWIFALDGHWEDMRRVMSLAAEECADVPGWARRATLRKFLEPQLARIREADPEEHCADLTARISGWVSSLPV